MRLAQSHFSSRMYSDRPNPTERHIFIQSVSYSFMLCSILPPIPVHACNIILFTVTVATRYTYIAWGPAQPSLGLEQHTKCCMCRNTSACARCQSWPWLWVACLLYLQLIHVHIYMRAQDRYREINVAYRRCTYVGRVYKIFSDVIECTSHDQRNKIRCP